MHLIYSLELQEIQESFPDITWEFLESINRAFPQFSRNNGTNIVINNILTVHSAMPLPNLQQFGVLLYNSRAVCNSLQIIKN